MLAFRKQNIMAEGGAEKQDREKQNSRSNVMLRELYMPLEA